MKVLMVNGSPHKDGNTATALSEIASQLEKHGIESETAWIGHDPVRGCIACKGCRSNGGECVFGDDLCNSLSSALAGSDALIVGSPVYFGQPNGALLALLQRMMYSNSAIFAGKPAAAVAVCRRGGATAALEALVMPFMMLNMPVVTSQYWNIAYGRTPGQAASDGEGMQTMRTLANNLAALLKATGGKALPGPDEQPVVTHFIR